MANASDAKAPTVIGETTIYILNPHGGKRTIIDAETYKRLLTIKKLATVEWKQIFGKDADSHMGCAFTLQIAEAKINPPPSPEKIHQSGLARKISLVIKVNPGGHPHKALFADLSRTLESLCPTTIVIPSECSLVSESPFLKPPKFHCLEYPTIAHKTLDEIGAENGDTLIFG